MENVILADTASDSLDRTKIHWRNSARAKVCKLHVSVPELLHLSCQFQKMPENFAILACHDWPEKMLFWPISEGHLLEHFRTFLHEVVFHYRSPHLFLFCFVLFCFCFLFFLFFVFCNDFIELLTMELQTIHK